MDNEQTEKIIMEALKLIEEGKSMPEILNLFPEHIKELGEIFKIMEILGKEKDGVAPDKKLLAKILSEIDAEVTTSGESRFILRDDEIKGRVSVNDKKIKFMTINWKLTFGVIVLAIVASVSYYQFVLKEKPLEIAKAPIDISVVPATGNVDDIVLALLNDADAETAILANIESDANLILADSQAIDDFGQSYNEEF